jgi:hypothetical protein
VVRWLSRSGPRWRVALADCKARRDDRSFLVPEFGVGATRGTTHKAASGKAAPAGPGPAVIGAPSGSSRPFNTQSVRSRAVRGAARHCCLRVLPDAFDDERIVHRDRAADYCQGHRPAAILAAAPAHDRGAGSVVITGLGKILVGWSSPENKNVDLHLLGALNIPVGCVAILLLSLSIRQVNRTVASTGTVLAIVGLAARCRRGPATRRAHRP